MLQNSNRWKPSGFTIPEVLLSAVIWGFVIIVVVGTYVMLSQIWKRDLTMNELSRNANVAIEKMIRGTTLNTGLEAARSISSPLLGISADNINYTDMNNVPRRFYYSANKIYNITSTLILSDVESVSFTNVGNNTVKINLTLHKNAANKEIKFSMETQVNLRNH